MSVSSDFIYQYHPGDGSGRPPLLLLHGTGGSEHDLIPLAQDLSPGSPLLSPRGQVSENGMARFFRRHAEGVLDFDDVRARAENLAAFIADSRETHALGQPIALGFSNGANMAAALLYTQPGTLAGAILLRAMLPLDTAPVGDLTGVPVLLLSGERDSMIPLDQAQSLATALEAAGARVDHRILAAGHGLVPDDIAAIREWLTEV